LLNQERLCTLDALPQDVLMRRQPGALLERAGEVKHVHSENVCKVHKREIRLEIVFDVFGDASQSIHRKAAAMLAKSLMANGMPSDQVRDQRRSQALSIKTAARIPSSRFISESQEQLRNERVFCAEGWSKLETGACSTMTGYRAEEVRLDFNANLFNRSSGSSGERNRGGHDIDAATAEAPCRTRLTRPRGIEEGRAAEKESDGVSGEATLRLLARLNVSLLDPNPLPHATAAQLMR